MFDPVGFVKAKIAMHRAARAAAQNLADAISTAATRRRLRRQQADRELTMEDQGRYIELGGRRDGGDYGPDY